MDEVKIEIKDYLVMLNLHKALLEAKFHENPDYLEVAASPIIADICNELVDVMAKIDEERDEKNTGRWDNWRTLKNQAFYRDRAIKNALLNDKWLGMDKDEKANTARNLLSPFVATEEEIEDFIRDVDEVLVINNL